MSGPAPPSETVLPFAVGARLLALRQARGASQRELARAAGITNANLSMIEHGRVSPTITTLEKILAALDLSLPEFFAPATEAIPEVYSRNNLIVIKRGNGEYRLMPPSDRETSYLVEHTLMPGAALSGTWLGRRGWISGLIQSGKLSLRLDGHNHALSPGDGFRFHLQRLHTFTNETQAPVVLTLLVAKDA